MLQVLRDVGEYDTIFFVPHEEEDDQVHVNVAKYKDHGEKIGGSVMGDLFDIIIFRMNEDEEITDLDRFEGILVDPRVYVSRMIKEDWFGMVTRKTTTSDKLADDVFASWKEM